MNAELLKIFQDSDIIYISPHFDDVCFSLGGLASEIRRGLLINLFTHTCYVENPNVVCNKNKVSELRSDEDLKFVKKCNLTRFNFSFEDTSALNISPYDLSKIEDEIKMVSNQMIPFLMDANKGSEKAYLFCPMGIGFQRNHLSTYISILNNLDLLRGKYELIFYADIPYAINPARLDRGLNLFNRITHKYRKNINYYDLTETDNSKGKIDLVNIYQSQHAKEPDIENFSISHKKNPCEMLIQIK
jgi:hypothetical protein